MDMKHILLIIMLGLSFGHASAQTGLNIDNAFDGRVPLVARRRRD